MKRNKNATSYCDYAHNCDKNINCKGGDYCPVFKHTTRFSSLDLEVEDPGSDDRLQALDHKLDRILALLGEGRARGIRDIEREAQATILRLKDSAARRKGGHGRANHNQDEAHR